MLMDEDEQAIQSQQTDRPTWEKQCITDTKLYNR